MAVTTEVERERISGAHTTAVPRPFQPDKFETSPASGRVGWYSYYPRVREDRGGGRRDGQTEGGKGARYHSLAGIGAVHTTHFCSLALSLSLLPPYIYIFVSPSFLSVCVSRLFFLNTYRFCFVFPSLLYFISVVTRLYTHTYA